MNRQQRTSPIARHHQQHKLEMRFNKATNLWFVLLASLFVCSQATNCFNGKLSLWQFCTPETINEPMSETQVRSVYEKLISTFDDENLQTLITDSLNWFNTQIKEAARSSERRKIALDIHKKRICNMVTTLEGTLENVRDVQI